MKGSGFPFVSSIHFSPSQVKTLASTLSARRVVRVYPGLCAAAMQAGHSAALAVWTLARHVDARGAGRVDAGDLRATALSRSGPRWTKSKFYRAVREARALGLLEVVDLQRTRHGRAGDGKVIVLRSLARAALALGVTDVGAAPVIVRLSALRTPQIFKAALLAAFKGARSHHTHNPISRGALRTAAGPCARTQRSYERLHNSRHDGQVKTVRNFELTGLRAALLPELNQIRRGKYFLRCGKVIRSLPNSYDASALRTGGRSGLRKVNHVISGGLLNSAGGQHKRVYFASAETAEAAEEKARKSERKTARGVPSGLQPNPAQKRFYPTGHARTGARLWREWSSKKCTV